MVNNRVLAATFGVLFVGWFMIRQAMGFYVASPAYIVWEDFVTYTLVLIFTPIVMWKARWTALGAMVVGIINIIARLYGLYTALTLAPSKAWGPAGGLVLVLVFTYFAFQAYREK